MDFLLDNNTTNPSQKGRGFLARLTFGAPFNLRFFGFVVGKNVEVGAVIDDICVTNNEI